MADRHIGRMLKNTYVLEEKVGVGGFGAVYRARHMKLGVNVAVKFLLPHASDLARQRFEREAVIMASIVHPNVARVFDSDHDDEDSPFIVMEWLAGASMRQVIDERGPLGFGETIELFLQFGAAMDAAHQKGVVHRDLKPQNLLLTEEAGAPVLKVVDFGIARLVSSQGTLTQEVAIGTPAYIAPETARGGSAQVDRRADIYAMGLLLYEFLTGRKAIQGEPIDIFGRHLTGEIVIPSVLRRRPELPSAVDEVIVKACASLPQNRYQSAGEMVRSLGAIAPESRDGALARLAHLREPPLELPALAPVDIAPPEPTALSLSSLDLAAQGRMHSKRRALITVVLGVVALLALGTGVAFTVAESNRTAPVAAPPDLAQARSVRFTIVGAPPDVRAFDRAHPHTPLPLSSDQLTLPRGSSPIDLRFEAKGYPPLELRVVPKSDGEIQFGAGR